MTKLIKKYTLLVVASIIIARVLTAIIMTLWPDILTTYSSDGGRHSYGSMYLERAIEYLFNIVFVYLIYKDFESEQEKIQEASILDLESGQENIKKIPILIITFFFNVIGVTLFLLAKASDSINNKKQSI